MGRDSGAEGWCILRTSPARTLPLAASLVAAGVEAWSPTQMVTRRMGRKRERVEQAAPVTATFVFARVHHLADLLALAKSPTSPHPAFSVFRHRDRIPVVDNRSLNPLRAIEERERTRKMKATREAIPCGTRLRMEEGAFAGMTGVVEGGNEKEAMVNFGAGFVVKIATWIVRTDRVHTVEKAGPERVISGIAD